MYDHRRNAYDVRTPFQSKLTASVAACGSRAFFAAHVGPANPSTGGAIASIISTNCLYGPDAGGGGPPPGATPLRRPVYSDRPTCQLDIDLAMALMIVVGYESTCPRSPLLRSEAP